MRCRVSVIIPAYNAARFIRAALESACAQTILPDEIIVIDDGSTDGTAGEVAAFGHGDLIRYQRQDNLGASAARNAGLDAARGEWIAFLDADDVWMPSRLERALAVADRHPDLVWVGAAFDETSLEGKTSRRGASPRALAMLVDGCVFENIFDVLQRDCRFWTSAMILHRRCFEEVGRFDLAMPRREDFDLWVRVGLRHPRVGYVTEPVARYIRRPRSITHRYAPMGPIDLLRHLRRRSDEVPGGEPILRPYASWMARHACKVWLYQAARGELRTGLREFPEWMPARWKTQLRLLADGPQFVMSGCARILLARLRLLGRTPSASVTGVFATGPHAPETGTPGS
jgi:glycosyltransferase involved in cell wall biosynthesis